MHRFQNSRHQLNLSHTLEHSKFEHANKSVLLEDPSMRTTTRGSGRKMPGPRHSKMSLRTRENSRGHISPCTAILSPTHNIDLSHFSSHVSPATSTSASVGKHKRSYTSVVNKFDVSESNSEIKVIIFLLRVVVELNYF